MRASRALGAVFISRAYGAWYDVDEATAAFGEGLDPVFVPPLGPGNIPTTNALNAEGLAVVLQGSTDVPAISGDDRLLPLLTAADEEELPVALIAHACQRDSPCLPLASSAMPASDLPAWSREPSATDGHAQLRSGTPVPTRFPAR